MNALAMILELPDFLPPAECAALVASSERAGYEFAPITTAWGPKAAPEVRNNARVMQDDVERAHALWLGLAPHVPAIIGGMRALGLNERFRFYRYEPGHYFRWHRDGAFVRSTKEKSLLTFMIYLNDGFEGGETSFLERRVVPKTGLGLVFSHELEHESATLVSGRKYVLRSDVMYGYG